VQGRIAWSDGAPATGIDVGIDGAPSHAATDAAGWYDLPSASTEPKEIHLSVHPHCWLKATDVPVSLANGDGATLRASDVILPAETDVAVDIEVSTAAERALKGVGYGRIAYAVHLVPSTITTVLTEVGRTEVDLLAGVTRTSIRVPYGPKLAALASLSASSRSPLPERFHLVTDGLVLTRDAVAHDRVDVSERCLLTGRVIAHDGRGLAKARVELSKPTATGPMPFFCMTNEDGEFLFVGMSGDDMTVSATYRGAESPRLRATVGGGSLVLQCPTGHMRFMQVVSGDGLVQRFDVSNVSLTFRMSERPSLPYRADGSVMLPPDSANMYLCWSDAAGLREAEVSVAAAPADSITRVDVTRLSAPPLGELRLRMGNIQGLMTLTLEKPAATPGFVPLQAGICGTQTTMIGIRPGTYRFSLKKNLFAQEQVSAELDLGSGVNEVNLAELLK
jgi:hypothetical protein